MKSTTSSIVIVIVILGLLVSGISLLVVSNEYSLRATIGGYYALVGGAFIITASIMIFKSGTDNDNGRT